MSYLEEIYQTCKVLAEHTGETELVPMIESILAEVESLKQQVEQGKRDAVPEDIRKDAELWKFAVRKGLITIHSERMVDRDPGTRCSWIQGHGTAADINNDYATAPKQEK